MTAIMYAKDDGMQKIITKVIVIETIRSGLIPRILWRGTNHSWLTIKIWVKKNKQKFKETEIIIHTLLYSHILSQTLLGKVLTEPLCHHWDYFYHHFQALFLFTMTLCTPYMFKFNISFCFSINKNWSNWTTINTDVICLDSEFYLVWS